MITELGHRGIVPQYNSRLAKCKKRGVPPGGIRAGGGKKRERVPPSHYGEGGLGRKGIKLIRMA